MNYLPQFKSFLQAHNYSPATIRNYLADIGRYQAYAIANTSPVIASPPRRTKQSHLGSPRRPDEIGTPRDDVLRRVLRRDAPMGRLYDDSANLFSPETLKSYISNLASDPNYHRYLSSLTKFCHFALDQQLITSNPIKKLRRTERRSAFPTLDDLIKQYQSYLTKKNKTPVTIKNYINDIQQYIRFCQNPSVIAGPFSVIASEHRERGNLNPMGLLRRSAPRNDAPRDDVTQ